MSKKHKIKNTEKRKIKSIQVPEGYEPLPLDFEVDSTITKTPWYKKRVTHYIVISVASMAVAGVVVALVVSKKKNVQIEDIQKTQEAFESFLESLPERLSEKMSNVNYNSYEFGDWLNGLPMIFQPMVRHWAHDKYTKTLLQEEVDVSHKYIDGLEWEIHRDQDVYED